MLGLTWEFDSYLGMEEDCLCELLFDALGLLVDEVVELLVDKILWALTTSALEFVFEFEFLAVLVFFYLLALFVRKSLLLLAFLPPPF